MTDRNISDTQPQRQQPFYSPSDFEASPRSYYPPAEGADFQANPHSDFEPVAYPPPQHDPYAGYHAYGETPYQEYGAEVDYGQEWQTDSSWYADAYSSPQPKRTFSWLWVLLSIAIAVVMVLISSGLGYFSGIQQRLAVEKKLVQESLKEQFDLAVADIQAQRYQVAQQRLEYIVQHDPAYPGAAQKLVEVKMALNSVSSSSPAETPVPLPTQGPTATPDTRGAEETFNSAKQALAEKNWAAAVDLLLKTRRQAPEYNSVRVDSMLYVAYRNLGIQKISQAALEEGMYNLSLAARYGPLDSEAQNYYDWANLYTVGASFWELDWGQAAQYFGQLAPSMPQLRDASGYSAMQRYQIALAKYGDTLAAQGDYCGAADQYNIAVQNGNAEAQPTAVYAQQICAGEAAPAEEATPEK